MEHLRNVLEINAYPKIFKNAKKILQHIREKTEYQSSVSLLDKRGTGGGNLGAEGREPGDRGAGTRENKSGKRTEARGDGAGCMSHAKGGRRKKNES